jgi:hypothetical protein
MDDFRVMLSLAPTGEFGRDTGEIQRGDTGTASTSIPLAVVLAA